MNKRICFVCDSFISDSQATITGPMVQTYLLGKELSKRKWEVHFIAYTKDSKKEADEIHEGLFVHWLPQRKFVPILNYFKILKRLQKVNASFYYQRGRDILTGITARYCKRSKTNFIWASAGETGVQRGKYIAQLNRKNRFFLKRFLLKTEAKINDWMCEYGIENADRIIVQTVYQSEQLKTNFERDSIVIKSGHPIPISAQRSFPFKVLWIGSIKPIKRPELFLQLAEICQDLDCEFWMAGQIVDQKYHTLIEKYLQKTKKLKFLGVIPFEKSQEIIAQAHVLVNTTEDGYEGLPNAFVQAWLSGTVTISFFCNPDSIITSQQLGHVSNSIPDIKNILQQWLKATENWNVMSNNAIRYARNEFGLESITDQIENLIKN
ncbi:glycosyltransferase [bacterium]|nr:glycosyltransferase [bacterium]